jgi:hypothetical protein
LGFSYHNERCFKHMLCLFSLIFVFEITMKWKIGNNNQTYPILINWLMFGSLMIPWQIFNTYSGRERNSRIYKYYTEILTLRIFTWQFSIERVSISATVESNRSELSTEIYKPSLLSCLYRDIVGLHDILFCIKMFWYLRTFLMVAAMLKFMFIYNQFMMLDDKSFIKCVCVLAATLTRSKINLEFVYLCISFKDFAPIFTISDYIHWAALAGCGSLCFSLHRWNQECLKTYYIFILLYSIYYVEIKLHIVSKN